MNNFSGYTGALTCKCLNNIVRLYSRIIGKRKIEKIERMNSLYNFAPKFKTVVSYTSRPIRNYETDGIEHYFISNEEADRILESEEIGAKTQIGDHKYFVTKKELKDWKKNLYVIDPKGIRHLLYYYPKLRNYTIIYVNTSKEVRDNRAKQRPDYNEEVYNKRVKNEDFQFKMFELKNIEEFKRRYNINTYTINNDSDIIDVTMNKVYDIILKTRKVNSLYLIVGRTCSGKDTICNELANRIGKGTIYNEASTCTK